MTEVDFEVLTQKVTQVEGVEGVQDQPTTEKKEKKAPDPFHYQKMATEYLMDLGTKGKSFIQYYQGRTLRYDGTRYLVEQQLGHRLRDWFRTKKIPANNTVIGNVIPWVESLAMCDSQKHPQLPFWRKKELCRPVDAITFANGILDARRSTPGSPVLIPHTYDWVSLTSLPYSFLPEAECPQWLAFLDEVLEGDQGRIRLLQEFFGYAMTADNSLQKMLVLRGVSRGGKGTVVKVLEALLGADNVTGFSLTALAERFGIGSLVGKLVAVVGEVNLQKSQNKYAIFETLNKITGDDPVTIEFKHQVMTVSTRLPVRFVVSCNEMPRFSDDSGAFAERLLVVDFEKACPPDKRDPELGNKLISECSGIANWALEGLARLRASKKFSVPDKMAATLMEIRRENSPTLAYLQDRVVVNKALDTGNLPGVEVAEGNVESFAVPSAVLEADCASWAAINGQEAISGRYLSKNLRTILPKLTSKNKRDANGVVSKHLIGLRLKTTSF